jgi:pimeloyl-[acyl-carrier protein] methyl ester esterase
MTQLILLPGWGFAPAVLQPLAEALAEAGVACQIFDLPPAGDADVQRWLAELDAQLPRDAWLGGWSLGGMLALALAARRGAACPGVITLASNARFVTSADWPHGMPAETFTAFRDGCAADPAATGKRFAMLCAQGCADARRLSRHLIDMLSGRSATELVNGLDVLAALDNRQALQDYPGPQLHLLASADALLPAAAADDLLALLPGGEVDVLEQSGHACLLEQPATLAALIASFIREDADD